MSNIPEEIWLTAADISYEYHAGDLIPGRLNGLIARALMAERERDRWQPIKTAKPKDGLILVGYGEYRERDGFSPAFMRWYDSINGWAVNSMPFYPTHFMPIPAPPIPHNPTEG